MNKEKKKKSGFKKFLKWLLISMLILLILVIAAPYLFKDKIKSMVENTINKNIEATVTFAEMDLSLLKNFPLATLTLENTTVINKTPFLGDTLFFGKEVNLKMSVMEFFKSANEPMDLQSIVVKNSRLNIRVNNEGIENYDIIKNINTLNTPQENTLSFNLKEYEVNNLNFSYYDAAASMKVTISEIEHTGKGNFAKDILDLDTKSTAKLSFDMDSINYMNNVLISLDAVIGVDLKNSIYTFKENAGFVNQLPLAFNGFIQLVEEGQLYDMSFKTPTSSFKNLLAIIPAQYAGNLSAIKTEGDFVVNGIVKGTYSETRIPTLDISFVSNNAMFKYADLPKAVQNIYIDSKIINTTGIANDTYIEVNKLTFTIDKDVFSANGNVRNMIDNPKVTLNAKGKINLENITKVYPVSLDTKLSGILNVDATASFDMNAIENKNYENIQNSGSLTLTGFKYEGKEVAKPFIIDKTSVVFNPKTIKLNEFIATTGKSDLNITGNLENFYGFIFKDQELKGNFTLTSNTLKVDDFLSDTETTTTAKAEKLKIPSFLNCTFEASAKTVLYDTVKLENVSGKILINNETVNLQDVKMDAFGGKIAMTGKVSTKEPIANFAMDLNLKELGIAESFSQLETLKAIAPIAKVIEGKLNSTLSFSGNLADDMTPDLNSITGNLLGQLLDTKLTPNDSKVLSLIGDKLNFLDVNKLNLNEVSAHLAFKDGQVTLKPFNLNYKEIGIQIGGTHGFDQSMNYDVTFDIPVQYLGKEVTNILAKLTPKDAAFIKSIPVTANLSGNFSSPIIKTDLQSATSKLVADLVEKQKQNLLDKGKDKLTDLLTGKNKNDLAKDSITVKEDKKAAEVLKDNTKDKVKTVLNDLFNKNKKKKDTVN